MNDGVARDKMVAAIEAYMNDEIQAFALDEVLVDIVCKTKDTAVKEAYSVLWFFYDDLKDHKIVVNKEEWNLMYRIILFLRSNAEVEKEYSRRWSSSQIMAFGIILLIALLVWTIGTSWALLIAWIGAGVLTWEIDRRIRMPLRNEFETGLTPGNFEVFPFDSVPSLFRAAKSVPDFHKRPFPPELAHRRIRNAFWYMEIPRPIALPLGFIGWTVFLPFVLLIQLFPIHIYHRTVIIPTTGS